MKTYKIESRYCGDYDSNEPWTFRKLREFESSVQAENWCEHVHEANSCMIELRAIEMQEPILRYAIQGDGSFHDLEDICLDRDWAQCSDYYIFDAGLSFMDLYTRAIKYGAHPGEVLEVLDATIIPF